MLTPPKHMQQPIQSHELKVPIADSTKLVYTLVNERFEKSLHCGDMAKQERRNIRKICISIPHNISHNLFPFSSKCSNCILYNLFDANDLLEYHQQSLFSRFQTVWFWQYTWKHCEHLYSQKIFISRISSSKIKFPLRLLCFMRSILESLSHCAIA